MNIAVKYNTFIDKIYIATDHNTEVEAFNNLTGEFEYRVKSECVLSRLGNTWLVKEPYLQ